MLYNKKLFYFITLKTLYGIYDYRETFLNRNSRTDFFSASRQEFQVFNTV